MYVNLVNETVLSSSIKGPLPNYQIDKKQTDPNTNGWIWIQPEW